MALCTSCGSEVDESASFCTSCGQRMSTSNAGATITVTRPICSSCGAQVDSGSVFCTNCGHRMAQPAVMEETAPTPASPSTSSSSAVCRSCGATLAPESSFCIACGQPRSGSDATTAAPAASVMPPPQTPFAIESSTAEPARVPAPAETAVTSLSPSVTAREDAARQPAPPAAPQIAPPVIAPPVIAPPIYATPTDYSSAQPGGGAFRTVVLILLLLIVAGAFGGWYFWGVETVIVCSPPDVRLFLDDKELQPSSYGRYVVPHLSRQSHLLKVQRTGFADTIQKLDFPLTSTQEWVNIKLVPRRQLEPGR